MRLKLLGTAAGGAFPQWNCHCRNCRGVRDGTVRAKPRTQSSLAIAGADGRWVLVNASPDVRHQIEGSLPPPAALGTRWSPVAAVILTDSQIDHATGLLFLREGATALPLYCTDPVFADLTGPFPVATMLGKYCGISRHPLPLGGESWPLAEAPGVAVTAIPLPGKAPPYSPNREAEPVGTTVALALADRQTGGSIVYAPGLAAIPPALGPYLEAADVLLVDGTCWHDDDLAAAGCGTRAARTMGHLPLAGPGGLLEELGRYPKARKILVHINNTNPLLDEDSPERAELAARGVEVGEDGQEICV
jgi:pyrroloquinoline quinone biosynthesis protein B